MTRCWKGNVVLIPFTVISPIARWQVVIASLARRAALSVEGVSRLSGNSLVDNLVEMVGSRRIQSRNINIILGEDNNVAIEIKVVLKFGCCIPQVASDVQKAVINEIEATTGMNVTNVHVLVQEIEEEVSVVENSGNDAE